VEDQTEVNSASDVAKEALQRSKVGLPWVMHMEADLLDNIGEICLSESGVL
jgi:hypothetical protein